MMPSDRLAFLALTAAAGGDADESWLVRLLPEGLRWRPGGPRSQRWLHGHLKAELGLWRLAQACAAMPPEVLALAAWPPDRLRTLVECLGLVLVGAEVRHAIARSDVLAYRQALGDRAYAFAMERAALLAVADPVQAGAVTGPATVLQGARRAGALALREWLSAQPASVWRRVALKLPVSWLPETDDGVTGIEGWSRARLQRLVRQVGMEIQA